MNEQSALLISESVLNKITERATNRLYSQNIENCKNTFTLHYTTEFFKHLSTLGLANKDDAPCDEPQNKEPVILCYRIKQPL